ncbi:tigger transposable element-derived protein 1-like isoform X1 [Brienomyrus brachyistius]|uniref:tigger transposable element-derived protein 1-like isoform X1 n=1 Tax=Brienomyrus brachyistius TaxID=42636 RepID=UPI0020B24960|nr:tigger transposable element-derived protein 1-like isoform X1 [Brienomyrus brachyistius]XP_048867190.1 tigger transposable element-derived protein 1-like isoform X1 [Brienomyrus brachyistius]
MSPPKVKIVLETEMKRARKALTIEQKIEVIKRIENGEKMKSICLSLSLAQSTVHTIFANREKIRKSYVSNVGGGKMHRVTSRHEVFEKLEKHLVEWMGTQANQGIPLSTMLIQQKAMSLFEDLRKKAVEEGDSDAKDLSFKASHGWFERFKNRSMLRTIITGEAASADHGVAAVFPAQLQKIINEGGYTAKQIFNVDEMGLFWKRMPSCTFISQNERNVPGHKASKDKLTLLLGGNCAGEVKLKPLLVYHSENPPALIGMVKSSLPVIWRSNRRAWVTREIFADYVQTYLSPFIKKYTAEHSLANKALLIIDSAPGHPSSIVDHGDNIQVVFLPPKTTSLLQPMDQGVITTFRAYYSQSLMQYLLDGVNAKESLSLKQLWKDFSIKKALEFIDHAWHKVSPKTMNVVWNKLCPQFVTFEVSGFEEVTDAKAKILALAMEVGFKEVDGADVEGFLQSHGEELTADELIQLDRHRLTEEEEEEEARYTLNTDQLRIVMDHGDKMTNIISKYDHDMMRSIAFKNAINSALAPFKELYERRLQEHKQSSILSCFCPTESSTSPTDSPQPSTSGTSSGDTLIKKRKLSFSISDSGFEFPPQSPSPPNSPLSPQE